MAVSSDSHAGSILVPASFCGSTMFSAAVSIGSRLKNWKMNPMWSRRSLVSAVSSRRVMSLAGDLDLPVGRLVEAGEDVHQGRLAGAGRPHHGGELAAGDVQRHAAQRVHGGVALAVAADDVAGGDDGLGGGALRAFGLHDDGVHGRPRSDGLTHGDSVAIAAGRGNRVRTCPGGGAPGVGGAGSQPAVTEAAEIASSRSW